MAQRVFATAEEYAAAAEELFDGTPEKLGKRLRSASIEVEKLTRLTMYDVDADGYATDVDVRAAFTQATIAIVEYWDETDDPTGAVAAQGAVKIGSVSLGTTSSAASAAESSMGRLTNRIGERALDILTTAGLRQSSVIHR
ncbi:MULTISPECIES: hypothetical protein [unclassified Cryobacterium]|uniref:hypothetical protein n=1 Tax=unclassified Cryobacterium TaxID=2649013 RepID=UPI002AB5941C|nr:MULTISPECIES: hypothetical protein [unclassified Cryobacterium]MDY7542604.1 hypothetical protein [Cryobacterium sp. 5B3]MEB0264724.1 hypothetical protein [Cryobacterium sp. 10I5]MEB0273696.1 hypothetical protein [Cryobacterium sp. 5B3]